MPKKPQKADLTVPSKPSDSTDLTQASPSVMSLDQVAKDPEFEKLLDPGNEDELAKLYEDVRRYGFRDPVVVGKIEEGEYVLVDGYRRSRVWAEKFNSDPAFAPKVVVIDFPDRQAAELWIIRNQLIRRNLTDAQRIDLVRKYEPIIASKAKENRNRGVRLNSDEGQKSVDTNATLAELAHVSRDTYCKGKKVLEHGTPELVQSLKLGNISINAAAQAVALPPEEQNEIAKAAQSSKPPPKRTKTPRPAKVVPEIKAPADDITLNQVPPCELTDMISTIGRCALELRRDIDRRGTYHVDRPTEVAELHSAMESLKEILKVIDPQPPTSASSLEKATTQPPHPQNAQSRADERSHVNAENPTPPVASGNIWTKGEGADADAKKRLFGMTWLIHGLSKELELMMHAIRVAAPTNQRSLEELFRRLNGEAEKAFNSSMEMVHLWNSRSHLTPPTNHNANV